LLIDGITYQHGDTAVFPNPSTGVSFFGLIVGLYVNENTEEGKAAGHSIGVVPYRKLDDGNLVLHWNERTVVAEEMLRGGRLVTVRYGTPLLTNKSLPSCSFTDILCDRPSIDVHNRPRLFSNTEHE
jgi:hypothetical protein